MKVQMFADYIDSYSGRDRVMRIIYYSSQLIGGLTHSKELATKLEIFSDQINSCRTVLRLFDDIPMLCYTWSYGFGKEDPDRFMRYCGLAVNILDQLYYPLEHIAWASDSKLLSFRSEPWWFASSMCWAISMYLMVFKSIRYYFLLRNVKSFVRSGQSGFSDPVFQRLSDAQETELMTAIRCFLDFVHAVHWLPSGLLWAGKLQQWHIGTLGFISSLISIYQSA